MTDIIKSDDNCGVVLVLDQIGLKLINKIFTMKDIYSMGITFIESFEVKWKPYIQFKSIYLIMPSEESFLRLA